MQAFQAEIYEVLNDSGILGICKAMMENATHDHKPFYVMLKSLNFLLNVKEKLRWILSRRVTLLCILKRSLWLQLEDRVGVRGGEERENRRLFQQS